MGNMSIKKVIERYSLKIINEDNGVILYKIPKNITGTRKPTFSHYKVKLMPSGKQKYLDKIKTIKRFEKEKERLLRIKTTITITRGIKEWKQQLNK